MNRRKFLAGIGAVSTVALAGCNDSNPENEPKNYNDKLRHSYSIDLPDSGETMAVNVDGRLGEQFADTKDVVIEVRLYSGDELLRTKRITVPETDKKTDWGVAFLLDERVEDVRVETEAVEVK